MKILRFIWSLVLFAALWSSTVEAAYQGDALADQTFRGLNEIRQDRKTKVLSYLNHALEKASVSRSDPILRKAFREFRSIFERDPAYVAKSSQLVRDIDQHYVTRYGEFYDILFVGDGGEVFYSVKAESDYGKNLFKGPLKGSEIARTLKSVKDVAFIDFDYYQPSKEAASFLAVRIEEQQAGWMVFQLPLNTINAILFQDGRFKSTGEVYLANHRKIMLTQSRFSRENTSFNLRVDTAALDTALESGQGNLKIDDYRGIKVFSSFERFDFHGVTWVIVAEIDEDEVITDHYQANKEFFIKRLFAEPVLGRSTQSQIRPDEKSIRVDINEYSKGLPRQSLYTQGIATCTGILLSLANRFSYLGHIYPLDRNYGSEMKNWFIKLGLQMRGRIDAYPRVDLLDQMLQQLHDFDIYPSEKRNLEVLLVATHTNSFENLIDRLIKEGLFLSQIRVLYEPNHAYANIVASADGGKVTVGFKGANKHRLFDGTTAAVPSLGQLVKQTAKLAF